MSNNRIKKPKISPESIQKQLLADSVSFIDQVIKSRVYLTPQSDAAKFWYNFKSVVNTENFFPDEVTYGYCAFISKMNLFFDLYSLYQENLKSQLESLKSLNPATSVLIKTLTLVVEIGDVFEKPDITPGYSFKSLKTMKRILREFEAKKSEHPESGYSVELYNCVKQLFGLKIDLETLLDFISAYETGHFDLVQLAGQQGYELIPYADVPDGSNQYILERLKTEIKQSYKKQEAQDGISGEDHFKSIDPVLNTDKGFAAIAVSGATLVNKPEGTTELKMDESIFDKMNSSNQQVQQRGFTESLLAFREQHFHYNYRHAMAEAYYPNDILDIHDYALKTNNEIVISLYDVFCVTSCLVAMADNYRYFSLFPGKKGVQDAIPAVIESIKSVHPDIEQEVLQKEVITSIVTHFEIIENQCNPFVLLTKNEIITQLRTITELNKKADDELLFLLDTICAIENSFAYNPLYKLGNKYIFLYKACVDLNFNRMVYDYFISDNLFTPGTKSNAKDPSKSNDKLREEEFCKGISNCLKNLTRHVIANQVYPQIEDQAVIIQGGEFDVLAYFEKENLILAIQVKLSNTVKKNENAKAAWVDAHVYGKAAEQIQKDRVFLSSKSGLEFASKKLNLKKAPKNPQIFHLVITDNFLADHRIVCLSDKSARAICISFFEFYNLLFNIRVHNSQKSWDNVIANGSINYFLNIIEQNEFWRFLEDISGEYKIAEKLMLINRQNTIMMRV
ncbi:hypothetical protein CJD36_021900 [Flavipsychrobacter stenotrophus]|uniref:Uncharacterized protein n=1 Tax=Flavipsychrobacter stenotrophus TaxID=2077091 RepID=A0A2S7SQL9_9BACT|nr:hypothetical protein [Flavipsychrobacter stenotrophus]PQJ08921.1 hypothetical protein CJD36_021900 [Flavipsychrobacter stenotrophus]